MSHPGSDSLYKGPSCNVKATFCLIAANPPSLCPPHEIGFIFLCGNLRLNQATSGSAFLPNPNVSINTSSFIAVMQQAYNWRVVFSSSYSVNWVIRSLRKSAYDGENIILDLSTFSLTALRMPLLSSTVVTNLSSMTSCASLGCIALRGINPS